ncbi:hypothetical protein CLU96_1864 [Chryseobacterium sp. 52]|nr:hypothetical protein CLU96_1864 [Chryseobacterium sp. 52]
MNTSILQTVEYCSFHKIENKKNITSCSFGPKLSKTSFMNSEKIEIFNTTLRDHKNSKCRIIC